MQHHSMHLCEPQEPQELGRLARADASSVYSQLSAGDLQLLVVLVLQQLIGTDETHTYTAPYVTDCD